MNTEHEVKLRVNDHKFETMERELNRLNSKLNIVLLTVVASVILKAILHHYNMI